MFSQQSSRHVFDFHPTVYTYNNIANLLKHKIEKHAAHIVLSITAEAYLTKDTPFKFITVQCIIHLLLNLNLISSIAWAFVGFVT